MVFPQNPVVGQAFTEYGRTWIFDGSGWASPSAAMLADPILPVRTVSQLNDAARDQNRQFRVTDAPGGEAVVYSDGSDYRRVSDQSPVV